MLTSSAEALSLYRSFLRVSRVFPHYNVREYIKRRAGEGFRLHAQESESALLNKAFSKARSDLDLAKRQSMVYGFYQGQKSVMDVIIRKTN
jgi:hypothetical protein